MVTFLSPSPEGLVVLGPPQQSPLIMLFLILSLSLSPPYQVSKIRPLLHLSAPIQLNFCFTSNRNPKKGTHKRLNRSEIAWNSQGLDGTTLPTMNKMGHPFFNFYGNLCWPGGKSWGTASVSSVKWLISGTDCRDLYSICLSISCRWTRWTQWLESWEPSARGSGAGTARRAPRVKGTNPWSEPKSTTEFVTVKGIMSTSD